jgi:hypothetical protein
MALKAFSLMEARYSSKVKVAQAGSCKLGNPLFLRSCQTFREFFIAEDSRKVFLYIK